MQESPDFASNPALLSMPVQLTPVKTSEFKSSDTYQPKVTMMPSK